MKKKQLSAFELGILTCLLAGCFRVCAARGENVPPDGASGFGTFYSDVFGTTVVYARSDWATFYYVHSGFEPKLPAPGWVQMFFPMRYFGADEVEVQLDGRPAFTLAGYPYFGMTTAQLESIVAAETVVIEARWWTRGRRARHDAHKDVKRREWIPIDQSRREFLRLLAEYGREWNPPDDPWMIKSSVGYVIDVDEPVHARLQKVKELVKASIGRRSSRHDQYCFVVGGGEKIVREPNIPRHIATFYGGNPDLAARARAFLDSLGPGRAMSPVEMRTALEAALSQKIKTLVLFTGDGQQVLDVGEAAALLRRFTARMFVVWCDDPASKSARRARLAKLCEMSGGKLVTLPE